MHFVRVECFEISLVLQRQGLRRNGRSHGHNDGVTSCVQIYTNVEMPDSKSQNNLGFLFM